MVESGPVAMEPVTPAEEEQVLDEQYLRSLHIDNLVQLLDRYGVTIPDTVDVTSAPAIVDYVVAEYGA